MSASVGPATEIRRCAFCGKGMATHLNQCPFCREMVPQVHLTRPRVANGREKIRHGLLYMLLASVIYYFAGGYGAPLRIPVEVVPVVTNYLLPLLFLGGLGFCAYGLMLRAKS